MSDGFGTALAMTLTLMTLRLEQLHVLVLNHQSTLHQESILPKVPILTL